MITVTLIYSNGTQWIAGGFPDTATANAWVAAQNLDPSVQVQIVTIPTPQAGN